MGVDDQSHVSAALSMKENWYLLYGGWMGPRVGLNGCINLPPPPPTVCPADPSRYAEYAIAAHIHITKEYQTSGRIT
jgi:hypothetical protein